MSYDDQYFMSIGRRVRHAYKRSRSRVQTCKLCGCKRRRTSSGWQWRRAIDGSWSSSNPPCSFKEEPE